MNNVVTLKLSEPVGIQLKLTMLCQWIDANIDKPIGWTELTEQSGMDHFELQQQFNAYMKTTPMQWIRIRRLELKQKTMAEQLLKQRQLPENLLTQKTKQRNHT